MELMLISSQKSNLDPIYTNSVLFLVPALCLDWAQTELSCHHDATVLCSQLIPMTSNYTK